MPCRINWMRCLSKSPLQVRSDILSSKWLMLTHQISMLWHNLQLSLKASQTDKNTTWSFRAELNQTALLITRLAIKQNSVGRTLAFPLPSCLAIYHSMIPSSCCLRGAGTVLISIIWGLGLWFGCCTCGAEHRVMAQQRSIGTGGHFKAG